MRSSIIKIYNFVVSMRTVLVLLVLMGGGAAVATFVENDFGSDSARAVVYNHWWFEVVIFLLFVALIGNIIRFKMWQKEKMPIFLFHASFLLMFFGAFVTRYFGYEGTMSIREGDTSNIILSEGASIKASSSGLNAAWSVRFTPITSSSYSFKANLGGGAPVTIKTKEFIQNASEAVVVDKTNGKHYASIMISSGSGEPLEANLFEGEFVDLGIAILAFGNEMEFERPAVVIGYEGDQLTIRSYSDLSRTDMTTTDQTMLRAHTIHPMETRTLYTTLEGMGLVVKEHLSKARKKVVEAKQKTGISAVIADVSFKGETKEVELLGGAGMTGLVREVELAGKAFNISYGSTEIDLPFSLKLDKFLIDRYPGSMSPSSYESHVTLIDNELQITAPHRIFMNNILMHRGYRFYQQSYDRDEKGTILSVSKDPGMWPTYIGYALMTISFFLAFFSPKSRFRWLAVELEKDKRAHFAPMVALLASLVFLQAPAMANELDQNKSAIMGIVDSKHARDFGLLLVQDNQGRIKPIDTLATEILNKVAKKDTLAGLSATQVFLGMLSAPKGWQDVKMIRLSHPEIATILGLDKTEKYASLTDFFDLNASAQTNPYKLFKLVDEANRTPQSEQSKLQKEILKVDERANIAYMVYQGYLLKIIPARNDPNYSWVAPIEMLDKLGAQEAKEAARMLYEYFFSLKLAQENGDWSKTNEALNEMKKYQKTYGAAVMPSDQRIKAEELLNRLNPFERLTPFYFVLGFAFLIFAFIEIFKPAQNRIRASIRTGFSALITLLFVFHTFALGLRWYVSGHAPWSNGYESMIYIAWATILAGILFGKRSTLAFPAATIFSALALMVAHLSWMDPQITTLVPVLKSYWLTIHVSVISASYGFLGLSALLGFISLILFALRTSKLKQINYSILEMTKINEMSMMIGLALLAMGNLFGAIWANESWGRYWSWDPKETWTFVTLVVYTIITHFRFIPHLKSAYTFAVASVVGFSSVLMTYFGVNYYLSGLHSYAGGDPMPIPSWLPFAVFITATLSLLAWLKNDDKLPLKE